MTSRAWQHKWPQLHRRRVQSCCFQYSLLPKIIHSTYGGLLVNHKCYLYQRWIYLLFQPLWCNKIWHLENDILTFARVAYSVCYLSVTLLWWILWNRDFTFTKVCTAVHDIPACATSCLEFPHVLFWYVYLAYDDKNDCTFVNGLILIIGIP